MKQKPHTQTTMAADTGVMIPGPKRGRMAAYSQTTRMPTTNVADEVDSPPEKRVPILRNRFRAPPREVQALSHGDGRTRKFACQQREK